MPERNPMDSWLNRFYTWLHYDAPIVTRRLVYFAACVVSAVLGWIGGSYV